MGGVAEHEAPRNGILTRRMENRMRQLDRAGCQTFRQQGAVEMLYIAGRQTAQRDGAQVPSDLPHSQSVSVHRAGSPSSLHGVGQPALQVGADDFIGRRPIYGQLSVFRQGLIYPLLGFGLAGKGLRAHP